MAGPGDDAFKQAQSIYGQGDIQGALTAAKQGLLTEPDNLNLNNLVGEIYLNSGQPDSALIYYGRAIQKKGKDPVALYGAGLAALNLKRYDESFGFFAQGEKSGKDKAKFLFGQGLALMEKSEFTKADLSFRKAIDKDKKNPQYHLALAEANYRGKTFPIALSEFNKAIEIDSSLYQEPGLHYKMAQAHLNMRNIPSAIEEYKIDLQLNPSDTLAWQELGKIYVIAKMVPEAAFSLEKYVGLKPDNGDAWFNLGLLYLQIQDQEKAAMAFERSIELKNKVPESFGYLAKIYSDRKEYERALDAYTRFETVVGAPDSAQYWFDKGKTMMKIGEKNAVYFDSAQLSFERATQIDPAFTDAYEYAGLTMYYQKDYARAIDYFNRLLQQDSANVNAYRNLAFAYLKTNDYANTTKTLKKVLELKNDDIIVRAMLARIYSFRGNFDAAVEQYEIILNDKSGQVTDSLRCEIYPDLGYDYLNLDKCTASLPILLKAEQCNPRDTAILRNIAASYQRCNSIKEAHTYYGKVLDIDPEDKIAKRGFLETQIQGQGG
jgi:tetratricopeptide (TPR) repeat protein